MDCNNQLVLSLEQLEEPHLAMHSGTAGETEQVVSEDLDHRALIMDITQAAKSDHLTQELHSNLGTPGLPSGWEWSEGQLKFQGCLYLPDQEILHLQVICNHHDHQVAGHFGEARTSELIHRNFHWPGLRRMVKDYVASCTTCACAKSPRHKPYRKLKQLLIPSQPWSSILMDFIEQLPASEGFSTILVVIDQLTKQAIFIPSHDTVNALQVAWFFLTHVFSKHGVPAHVTSDHGSEFVSHFFHSLGKLLRMRLHFTLGYHLEITLDPQAKTSSAEAQTFMADLECVQVELKENIAQAQERYRKNVDKHRAEAPKLNIGDQAYVKAKFFRTRQPSKKLSEKNLGPYDVIGKPGTHSVTLRLLCQFRSVHPVFHVSQLEPARPNLFPLSQQPPPPPLQPN